MKLEEANALLPTEVTKAVTNPLRLKYLLIGPPKWGKTTMMCAAPDSLLLAFEEGHAFHETHKIIIDAWNKPYSERGLGKDDDGNFHLSFDEAVEAIVASDRFQFIVIDTADMAAKMCLDYHYKKYGVNHASDAGDYGKGWDLCLTQPFRQQIGQLMKSGRGVGFITHTNIVEKKVGNTTVSRAETTLPSQVQKFLHTQADLILHGNFGKKRKGQLERDRVISMDGSNEILAGSRVRKVLLPKKFIVDPDNPWGQWTEFFKSERAVHKADEEYRTLVLGGKEEDTVLAAEAESEETISGEPASEPESTKGAATPATARPNRKVAARPAEAVA
jgi:hypothetical protein